MSVPCGKCFECANKKRADWTFRLKEELQTADSAYFITLTYNDENVKNLNKREIQLFLKRLRKAQAKLVELKIRYFLTAEYGSRTNRPHYHIILINVVKPILEALINGKFWVNEYGQSMGHVDMIPVSDGNIHYINKFHVVGKYTGNPDIPPFNMMSKSIGKNWLNKQDAWNAKKRLDGVIRSGEYIQAIPKYYKKKLFNIKESEVVNAKMTKINDEKNEKFRIECELKGVKPWKHAQTISETKRKNFISKTIKKEKL